MFHLKTKTSRAPVRAYQMIISTFLNGRIRSGPFKDIKIIKNWTGSALLPKLLGTYEQEIADTFYSIVLNPKTDSFLDIGCAGGYYLAIAGHLRNDIKLSGIDASELASAEIDLVTKELNCKISFARKIATASDVLNICNLQRFPLILIDIEGCEFSLLNELSATGGNFSNGQFIIELHNYHPSSQKFNPHSVFKDHNIRLVEFYNYGIPCFRPTPSNFIKLLNRHELRDPNTAYLIATSKSFDEAVDSCHLLSAGES